MKYVILAIIVCIGISVIIAVIISNKNKNDDHIIPPTPEQKDKCDISNDPTTLKKCDPTDQDTCNNCANGLHSCFQVTDENPFKLDIGDDTVNVPNGNWCLPAKIESRPCNRFTGYPVLTKLNDTEYAWRCQCKYPSLFNNQGVFGDCINQVACNSQGDLVCPDGSDYCTHGDLWPVDESKSWDPTLGVCKCNPGTTYINESNTDKRCVSDTCDPGTTVGGDCDCSNIVSISNVLPYNTFIKCPTDLPAETSLCKYSKQCIKDPCNPHGHYNKNTQQCDCDEANGFRTTQSSSSPVKSICFNPCNPGPCGKRGNCVVDTTTNKATCVNCKSPWFDDDTHMCLTVKQQKNTDCSADSQCISNNCGWAWIDPAHVGPRQCH